MIAWIVWALSFFVPSPTEPVRVMLVDTIYTGSEDVLCSSPINYGLDQPHSHANMMVREIRSSAKDADYCIISVSVFPSKDTYLSTRKALYLALEVRPDILVYAFNGGSKTVKEETLLKKIIAQGTRILTSGGNHGENVSLPCFNSGWACYDIEGVQVVGPIFKGKIPSYANTGNVITHWEKISEKSHGSSGATAIRAGRLVREFHGLD